MTACTVGLTRFERNPVKASPWRQQEFKLDISEVIWRTVMFLPKMENELVKCFEREDQEINFGHNEFKITTGCSNL